MAFFFLNEQCSFHNFSDTYLSRLSYANRKILMRKKRNMKPKLRSSFLLAKTKKKLFPILRCTDWFWIWIIARLPQLCLFTIFWKYRKQEKRKFYNWFIYNSSNIIQDIMASFFSRIICNGTAKATTSILCKLSIFYIMISYFCKDRNQTALS